MNIQQIHRHRLQALAGQQPRAEAPAVQVDGSTAQIRLYDVIDEYGDWWGVSSREFTRVLDELPVGVGEIRLLINSPGGSVFEGIAIMNALRRHSARVVAIVEGLAASAASFIAVSADEVIMSPNSELMIHDAWGVAVGNAAELRQYADLLDHLSDNIASVYAARAGGTAAEWREIMTGEAWYSADEAVAAGLADRVDDGRPAAENRFDLSVFQHAGRAAAPPPPARPTAAATAADPAGDAPASTDADPAPAGPDPSHSLNAARLALV